MTVRNRPGPSIGEMRSFLEEILPAYMIPSAFEILDEIPLTINGKVDKNALPAPARIRPKISARFVAPRTRFEKELTKIWQTVLCIDEVGVHDSFFELGGDSLAAAQIISRVIRQFQSELPLQSFFQSPTVEGIATIIAVHQAQKVGDEELKSILQGLESLSDAEADRHLTNRK